MTGFDLLLAAIIVASSLLALIHGIIKELFSLAAWILGLGAAILLAGPVGEWFPVDMLGSPHLRYVVAFVLILVGVLILGALLGTLLKSSARAIGLGTLDRLLGGLFGVVRGVLIAMIMVLVFASTAMAAEPWFAKSTLVPRLLLGAAFVRQSLPVAWADYLGAVLHPQPLPDTQAAPVRPAKRTNI
ncbi:MAG: CvpA family protein [Casimicrobiaceae bacterium]